MDYTITDKLPTANRTLLYTPRTRERQRFSLGVGRTSLEEGDNFETLGDLLQQTWNVLGVSTLFGFQQGSVQLKQYAKRLREHLANTLSHENVIYDVKVSLMEHITPRPSSMDPTPVKIEVYSRSDVNEENVEKCIYKGILLSWRSTHSESYNDYSVKLPLLLCRGTQGTMDAIHNALTRMFDCMVTALHAKEDDLTWLVPIMIVPTSKYEPKSSDEIRMEYVVPGLPVTDTIVVNFRVLDLVKVLTLITKDENNETNVEVHLNLEHIEKFYEVLYTQMLETAGLQLGLCRLHRIILPMLTITGNKMKVMNTEAMNRVLLYLNEKALDTFHTIYFNI